MHQESATRSRLDGLKDLEARAHRTHYKVSALAKDCGVTARQFQRIIRLRFGMAPHVWLVQIRLARGDSLLEHAGLVKEAAVEADFKDPAHFTRSFKHLHGLPPTALRHAGLADAEAPQLAGVDSAADLNSRNGGARASWHSSQR